VGPTSSKSSPRGLNATLGLKVWFSWRQGQVGSAPPQEEQPAGAESAALAEGGHVAVHGAAGFSWKALPLRRQR